MRRRRRFLEVFYAMTVLGCVGFQMAALRTAAGGTSGSNGFADVSKFLDNLATYLIYLVIPLGVLGIIAAGGMMISGNPEAQPLLVKVALGVGIVLLAKGIMA